jgi:hypothetical protein
MTTTDTNDQTTIETPAWASATREPEDGDHSGSVTVGPWTLHLSQDIHFGGGVEPITVWFPEQEVIGGAQDCRDLAAALLAAADVIDAATA